MSNLAKALEDMNVVVVQAIKDFDFADYGMDDMDPNDEVAEWVIDLAEDIVGKITS